VLSLAGILAYGFAPLLVAFFVPGDAEVIAEGARFIRIMCLAWGGIGIRSVWWRHSGRLATC
jgi:Na+-driven multidrug efflux pump